jgi:malonate transporter and related proteins
MAYVLTTLWPLFILIAAGFTMQRRGFPNPAFWPGAERFNYFVLFPALLFNSLSTAPLGNPALPRLLAAVALVLAFCCAGLLAARRLQRWPAARFGVLLQGTLRFNTYLGLAAVGGLYGKDGLLLAAVILAIIVPAVNVLSVWALSAGAHTNSKSLAILIAKNPLILSCLGGALLNLSGFELKWGIDRLVTLLANTSLPLGLLSVGAALKPGELHGEIGTLVASSLTRLLAVPAVALICAHFLKLPAIENSILVLFFALPTAPTAYVLTRQLGGDAHLMAGIITLQTLLSVISLTLVLSIVT